jgi:acetyltransferase-like isoleucine patch superfamily enzyme
LTGNLRKFIATSDHPVAKMGRWFYRALTSLSVPAPKFIVVPICVCYIFLRAVSYEIRRILIAEPFFKSYCTRYGRRLKTGIYLHWIQGKGQIIIGDNVTVDGKCGFTFAARFCENPTLEIGNNCFIGHECSFTVGKRITIGNHCLIASNAWFFDSPGHPIDPADRLADLPPAENDVKPITIGDNVWIGRRAVIFPGVTVGNNSVISAGAVVTTDVPANCVVVGNPARRILSIGAPPIAPVLAINQ